MKSKNFKKVICFIITSALLLTCALVNADARILLRGDVDGSGSITPSDARMALRAAARLESLTGDAFIAADVDDSGALTPSDARSILRVAARLEVFESPEIEITEETEAPSTEDTTIEESTTQAPTTEEPTTQAPTTQEPTTQEPTTQEPTTQAPTTQAPTTQAPTTQAPTTQAPTTQEPTTQEPTTSAPSNNGVVEIGRGQYPAAIDAFFSGRFYMKSIIANDDGTESEVEMAIDGDKMEVVIPVNGMTMGLCVKDNKTYLKIKVGLIWNVCEMTEALQEEGFDFDISEMTGNLQYGSVDDFESIVKYTETLDGTQYTVYSFISENGSEVCFYADRNDNIKSMITKNANGVITSRYDIISLSDNIPSSMFKTSGIGYLNIPLEDILGIMGGLAG